MFTILRRTDTEGDVGGSGGGSDPFPLSLDQQSYERKSLNRWELKDDRVWCSVIRAVCAIIFFTMLWYYQLLYAILYCGVPCYTVCAVICSVVQCCCTLTALPHYWPWPCLCSVTSTHHNLLNTQPWRYTLITIIQYRIDSPYYGICKEPLRGWMFPWSAL